MISASLSIRRSYLMGTRAVPTAWSRTPERASRMFAVALFFLTASACTLAVFGKDAVGAAVHKVLDVAQVPPVIANPDVPALGGSFKGVFQVDDRADEQGFPAPDNFHYFPFFKRAGGKPGDRRAEGDGGSPEGEPVVGRAFGHVQEVGGRYVKGFHRGRPRVKL